MTHIKLFEEFINEKTVTLEWDDNEQTLNFSDVGPVEVNYDGDFQYRGKLFSTADHQGPEDLIDDLTKAFRGDKFVYASDL